MTAHWVQTPTKRWVIKGNHDELSRALANQTPVTVHRSDGTSTKVRIEYVGEPRSGDLTIAWPAGTKAGTFRRIELPSTPERRRRQYLGGPRRTREYKALRKGAARKVPHR